MTRIYPPNFLKALAGSRDTTETLPVFVPFTAVSIKVDPYAIMDA